MNQTFQNDKKEQKPNQKNIVEKYLCKNEFIKLETRIYSQSYRLIINMLFLQKKLTLQLEFYFYLCHKLFIVTDIYIACKRVSRLILNLH